MAFDTLEHRNVAEVDWMLKWLVCLVARFAFAVSEASKIDGMLKRAGSRIVFRRARGIVDYRMADVAIIPDHFARVANMLTIMTAETSRRIKMADVIRMRLPICLHLREKVRLENALNFFDA